MHGNGGHGGIQTRRSQRGAFAEDRGIADVLEVGQIERTAGASGKRFVHFSQGQETNEIVQFLIDQVTHYLGIYQVGKLGFCHDSSLLNL